jgi:methylenetetrahydrofolate dehydrogenase (NADP+)/methenyltetrahydrofolate cyclohydrolase
VFEIPYKLGTLCSLKEITMAERLSGLAVSQKIQTEIKDELLIWAEKKWPQPKLSVVLVGDDPASQVYVGHKEKMCQNLGYLSEVIRLPKESTEDQIRSAIEGLNQDQAVDGILVQLPLPQAINERRILETISPDKDADCLTEKNLGKILTGQALVLPCTPSGIIEILKYYNINISGQNIAVIGRSLIVGLPLFHLLNKENATVTVFHSKSKQIKEQIKGFDIVCVGIGRPHHFSSSDFKAGAVVVDVGMHRLENKLIGDVDLTENNHLYAYTPVPGGVGPMTIAMLMKNTLNLASRRRVKK